MGCPVCNNRRKYKPAIDALERAITNLEDGQPTFALMHMLDATNALPRERGGATTNNQQSVTETAFS